MSSGSFEKVAAGAADAEGAYVLEHFMVVDGVVVDEGHVGVVEEDGR